MPKGLFITFEGPEAVGKSTQLAILAETLRARGLPVIVTREPGAEIPIGPKIQELLLHGKTDLAPMAELLLFFAGRAQHVAELIRPAVAEGQIVLCDRYLESTIAYQGCGRGLSVATIEELHKIATGDYMPDITFIFTGSPHRERGDDRFERLGSEFHRKVSRAYEMMAFHEVLRKPHYRHIAANRSKDIIAQDILRAIDTIAPHRA